MGELDGRLAVVTGGGTGLGFAIADRLAEAGAGLVLFEINPESGRAAAAELAAKHGVAARSYPVDVSDRRQVQEAVASVADDAGPVDILVNNAGVSHVGKELHDVTDAEWDASIGVMQNGTFYCMRAIAPQMLERRRGSIVNIASIRGTVSGRERAPYCVPKAAIVMMTRAGAADWADRGVRVNSVSPGFQHTPMWDADIESGAVDGQRLLAMVPAGRIGEPREVGDLVVFLCSDRAAYITGADVLIDGGLTTAMV
jgi:NAD(P)-dependent dehydrogenase (short-subunit alcohol dehydrogenase family)